jgi:hypothetical protein
MNRHEIDLAPRAQGQKLLEPGETAGTVCDSGGAERGFAGEWHHVLAVRINSVLGGDAGLAIVATIWFVKGEEVTRAACEC